MSAVAHLPVFILVKIFAPGVASLIRDFAAVAGGAGIWFPPLLPYSWWCCPYCAQSCQYTAQCAKIRAMENKTPRA